MSFSFSVVCAGSFDEIPKVFVDNRELSFPTEPENRDGEIYVPIRTVLEAFLNRRIDFQNTDEGKFLRLTTSDGIFSLNINNGVYAYEIENAYYGSVSLFDDSGDDKMGILEHKPYIKNGYTMLPVGEIIEILDGKVNCDTELGEISIVSALYTDYTQFVGEPLPVVFAVSDLDIYSSAKIADCKGFEEYLAECLEYDDRFNYDDTQEDDDLFSASEDDQSEEDAEEDTDTALPPLNDGEYYNKYVYYDELFEEIVKDTFAYLYEYKNNPHITGMLKDFLNDDYCRGILETDKDLSPEDTALNCAEYFFDNIWGKEKPETLSVGEDYYEFGKYIILLSDYYALVSQIDVNKYGQDGLNELEKYYENIDFISTYITSEYDDEFYEAIEKSFQEVYENYSFNFEDTNGLNLGSYNFNL